jgi:PadR family transcriptional regulator PadR
METRLNRKVSIGALQTVLRRLEKKSFLTSKFGEKTKIRGGKRKRFFSLTLYGKKVLTEVKEQRMGLWSALPEIAFSS